MNEIVFNITNHYNFSLAEYKLQKFIINNYNTTDLNSLLYNPYLYKYWVIANILNYKYIPEYKEYFDNQYIYIKDKPGYVGTGSKESQETTEPQSLLRVCAVCTTFTSHGFNMK